MNTMELTEDMEIGRKPGQKIRGFSPSVPAWMKLALYIGLGAATYQGLLVTYDQAKKALIQAKYAYISGVIAEELDGKSFKTSTDLRDNKKHQFGDLSPAQMSMAIFALSNDLYQCQALLSDINSLSNNIQTVRDAK